MALPLVIGSDHAGFELKQRLKRVLDRLGVEYRDAGPASADAVDYPDFAHAVAGAVSRGEAERGVLVCGSGQGMAMAANRHRGVRAALPWNEETARLSREHNDANVLALGARTLREGEAEKILDVWLKTPFAGGRHLGRVGKIDRE
ncbi:MAG TPA: ribose 5-phosphate isomerase B [Vicinamibacteria bacterium]|nr:ribose 5-phosphate isomerase B [Vicinamibacteria bacterium]